MIKKIFLAIAAFAMLNSCYYDVEQELYGEISCNLPETVSYSEDLNFVIEINCATSGCHSSTGTAPGDFATYDGFITAVNNGSIQTVVIDAKTMPPSGPLNQCDIELLQQWINEGANDN